MRRQWLDNIGLGAGRVGFEIVTRGLQLAVFESFAWAPQLSSSAASTWLVALVGYDFLYYWAHRTQHRVGILWATHAVHHQATEMNVTVGLRSAMHNGITQLPFFLPLAMLGVPTSVFLGVTLLHLVTMMWLHTPSIGHLGWLERWLNTPLSHALHHSADAAHFDKNFGGLLIIWDRIFGTYAPPAAVDRFGMLSEAPPPLTAHINPYRELLSAVRDAGSFRAKLRVLVG